MNNRDREDELERMRARRSGTRQRDAAGRTQPRTSQQPYTGRTRREIHNDYDEEYYLGEDYGHEEDYGYEEDGDFEDILIEDDRPRSAPNRRRSGARSSRPQAGAARTQNSAARQGRTSAEAFGRSRSSQPSLKNQTEGKRRAADSIERGRRSAGRQQGQMAKRRKKGKWKGLLLLLLAAFVGYGAWLFLHKPTGYWNVAVFGVDSRDGNTKNALADVQMIASINRSTGEIRLVSVYRDTYLKINSEGTYHKINEAYFKGGHKQAVNALEENLDLEIDDYATFNWKAVAEAINILGGVDLEITPSEFEYINGFITETVNSTGIGSVQLTQAGMNHLDGVQAVAYCRLRLMDTDFQRTERQRKVVMLALEKAKQADVSTLSSLAAYLIPEISTSVGVNDVLPLVKDINKYHIGETGGFPFSRQSMRIGKMDCVVPTTLESNVVLLHQFLYGEETSYSPSSAVRKISAHISEETGLYEEGKAAPSGGSSGKGSSGGGQAPVQTAPAETPPPETAAPSESIEESIADTEEEETTAEERENEIENGTEESEEVGPGVSDKPSRVPETTDEAENEQGPGVNGPGGSDTVNPTASQPHETSAAEEPGISQSGPGGPGGGSSQDTPSDQSSTEAGPGL